MFVTSRPRYVRYEKPAQPAPVRIYNSVAAGLRFAGVPLSNLSEEVLCDAARGQTGLKDFGDDSFREPLRLLLRSLESEAGLHPFGRWRARQLIMSGLTNRLRLEDDWKRSPQILQQEVTRPLFILGLPRTGTTLLFNLLACDPAHRWLSFWEAHTPSPPPERATHDNDPRLSVAARYLRILDYLVPSLAAIHEFGADQPEECYALLANSFAGVQYSWGFWVPTYDAWLAQCDMLPVYRYFRRQLQLLQWKCPGDRWVLKSPVHLYYLDALFAAFPDACIVQLHRDPLKVLPSACSLRATLQGMCSCEVDPIRLGRRLASEAARDVERSMQVRATTDSTRFHDVHYRDLMKDPLGVIKGIYQRFGDSLRPEVERRIEAHRARNPQDKHGIHVYSLEQFGLDAETERHRFARYCAHFRVEEESPEAWRH